MFFPAKTKILDQIKTWFYSHLQNSLAYLKIVTLYKYNFVIFHLVQLVDANVSIETLFSRTCRASRRLCILWVFFWASGHLGQFIKISNNIRVLVFVRESGSGHLGFWRLGIWVSGRLGIWVSGVWASGFLGVWASGHLGVWASGFLGVWASGFLDVWASGPIY